MRQRRGVSVLVFAAVLTLALSGCAGSNAAPSGSGGAAGGQTGSAGASEGQQLVETKCKMCHSLDRVNSAQKTPQEWETTVTRMQRNGLVITEDEKSAILQYLAK